MVTHFEFKKFKPSAELALYANAMLLHLMDFMPNGTIEAASMTRNRGRYLCSLRIFAHEKVFAENVIAQDPKQAVDKAGLELQEKMREWQIENLKIDLPNFWRFKEIKAEK